MKQKTINKIIENHCLGQHTHIGQYAYNLARDPETNKCYIIQHGRSRGQADGSRNGKFLKKFLG